MKQEIKAKPNAYRKILKNKPVAPVKLKKDSDKEMCECQPHDPWPCSQESNCIVRQIQHECGKNCPAREKCQNKRLRNREYAKIKIQKTANRGFGVVAASDIPAGTLIIEYIGELINKAEMKRRLDIKKARGDKDYYVMGVDGDLFIDAEPAGNLSRFINHSCDPNSETEKITVDGNDRIAIISKYKIEKGTELTFNYLFEYMEENDPKLPCLCGTLKCSGFIGGKIKKEEDNHKLLKAKKKGSKKTKTTKQKPNSVQKPRHHDSVNNNGAGSGHNNIRRGRGRDMNNHI